MEVNNWTWSIDPLYIEDYSMTFFERRSNTLSGRYAVHCFLFISNIGGTARDTVYPGYILKKYGRICYFLDT